ncbi:MAG TPA: hypothetical protein VF263_03510 [Longimicrobiaceae bacterium]
MDAEPFYRDGGANASPDDLSAALDALLDDASLREPEAHTERLTMLAAILSEALRRRGMVATLVGGGALEFHMPEGYVTHDIDLVVESTRGLLDRGALDAAFRELGFVKQGRHWIREDVFVEVPGSYMDDPVEQHRVGPFALRVVRPEVVLIGRLVEFDQTGHTGHGAQAALMLRVLGTSWDNALLAGLLRRERCDNVYSALLRLARSGEPIIEESLRDTWDRLHGRMPEREDEHTEGEGS